MGLLDSVLGAVINSATQNSGANHGSSGGGGLGGALGGALGGSGGSGGLGGGLGGLIALAASNPQLVQVVMDLLGNQSPVGGLPGLLARFQQAGLGNLVASWLSNGPNAALSGEQMGQVLGAGPLAQIAAQLGVGQGDAARQLSQLLPGLIDQLTPNGQLPAGGAQAAAPDLMAMLGGRKSSSTR